MLSSSGKSFERMTTSFQVICSPFASFLAEGCSFSFTTGVSVWLDALRKRAIPIQPSASRGRSRTTLVRASSDFLYSANPLRAAICGKSFSIASTISRSSSTTPVSTSARLNGPTALALFSISAARTALRTWFAAGTPILQRSWLSAAFSDSPFATSTRSWGEAWLPAVPATGTKRRSISPGPGTRGSRASRISRTPSSRRTRPSSIDSTPSGSRAITSIFTFSSIRR